MTKQYKPSKNLKNKIMSKIKKLNTPEKCLEEATRQVVKYTLMGYYPGAYDLKNFEKNFQKAYKETVKSESKPLKGILKRFGTSRRLESELVTDYLKENYSQLTKDEINKLYETGVLNSRAVEITENLITNCSLFTNVTKTRNILFDNQIKIKGLEYIPKK